MSYIDEMVEKIKKATNDDEIKDVLLNVFVSTQMDSKIRNEFDEYNEEQLQAKYTKGKKGEE